MDGLLFPPVTLLAKPPTSFSYRDLTGFTDIIANGVATEIATDVTDGSSRISPEVTLTNLAIPYPL